MKTQLIDFLWGLGMAVAVIGFIVFCLSLGCIGDVHFHLGGTYEGYNKPVKKTEADNESDIRLLEDEPEGDRDDARQRAIDRLEDGLGIS